MLARIRAHVDTLNARARTAALSNGQVTGPVVTQATGTGRPVTCSAPAATTGNSRSARVMSVTATATGSWDPGRTAG